MNERIQKLLVFLESSPNDPFLNHAIALEYVKIGDEQLAMQHFERNRSQQPNYVATYYHLAKTLERLDRKPEAMQVYAEGMKVARDAKDMHTYNELQFALEDIEE